MEKLRDNERTAKHTQLERDFDVATLYERLISSNDAEDVQKLYDSLSYVPGKPYQVTDVILEGIRTSLELYEDARRGPLMDVETMQKADCYAMLAMHLGTENLLADNPFLPKKILRKQADVTPLQLKTSVIVALNRSDAYSRATIDRFVETAVQTGVSLTKESLFSRQLQRAGKQLESLPDMKALLNRRRVRSGALAAGVTFMAGMNILPAAATDSSASFQGFSAGSETIDVQVDFASPDTELVKDDTSTNGNQVLFSDINMEDSTVEEVNESPDEADEGLDIGFGSFTSDQEIVSPETISEDVQPGDELLQDPESTAPEPEEADKLDNDLTLFGGTTAAPEIGAFEDGVYEPEESNEETLLVSKSESEQYFNLPFQFIPPPAPEPAPAPKQKASEPKPTAEQKREGADARLVSGYTFDKFADYNQCEGVWADKLTNYGKTMCSQGCGPTAVAEVVHVLTDYKDVTPETMRKTVNSWNGFNQYGSGFDTNASLAAEYGVQSQVIDTRAPSKDEIKTTIENGGLVLVAGQGVDPFVPTGQPGAHFLIIRGLTAEGDYLLANPYDRKMGTWEVDPTSESSKYVVSSDHILNNSFGGILFYK